ncbi:hypothetical protein UPYG_G00049930 [Umbra pygmaea]|uniref:SEA domain-containing protein n=1 Tax=Umbra pygmaea TaxID=75934 RepID=A0ABD0XTR7_UMBPY
MEEIIQIKIFYEDLTLFILKELRRHGGYEASEDSTLASSTSGNNISPEHIKFKYNSINCSCNPIINDIHSLRIIWSYNRSLGLQFSLNQNFTPDLSNSSSPAFQNLSNAVVTAVNNIYSKIFPAFKRSFVRSFRVRSGSVVANMTLVFNTTASTPNTTSALAAFNNVTGLDVIANSTSVFVVPASPVPTVPASSASAASASTVSSNYYSWCNSIYHHSDHHSNQYSIFY